jgi:hypothetical protein
MRGLASPPRLPRPPKGPTAPTGRAFIPKGETLLSGPGDPPPGFLNGQNSLTEWVCYWALFKIFGQSSDDPRRAPFYGLFPFFEYQSSELGGYTRALGSAVVDFVVFQGGTIIGIRIQTERFHTFASSRIQANDAIQRANLEANGLRVIDVHDDQLLPPGDGQKGVIAMKQAIGMLEKVNPIYARTAIRASRLKGLG